MENVLPIGALRLRRVLWCIKTARRLREGMYGGILERERYGFYSLACPYGVQSAGRFR